ncbi:hypothetical protein PG993_004907 [Apiospora rasikravindrae]|uniref:Uncharacterized protein n=1 Tax=Apiospora rasikravindrae TaxID=990691 RepID=A0ABR1TGU2_9PEZI
MGHLSNDEYPTTSRRCLNLRATPFSPTCTPAAAAGADPRDQWKGQGKPRQEDQAVDRRRPRRAPSLFERYADVCKAGMTTLKPRDRSKRKTKAKKKKTTTAAGGA